MDECVFIEYTSKNINTLHIAVVYNRPTKYLR